MTGTARAALVTGASGFVGSHLVDLLTARGDRVRALVRPTSSRSFLGHPALDIVTGDVADESPAAERDLEIACAGCDVVYHVAGLLRAQTQDEYDRVNARGAARLAGAAARAGVARFLLVSSQAASGPPPTDRPREEFDPDRPVTAYGRSKLGGEKLTLEVARESGLHVSIVRPPAVYGPRDRAFLTVFRLVSKGILPLYAGAARQEVSVIHARDLVLGLALAAERAPAGAVYFLTDGAQHTAADLGAAVARALGRRPLRFELPAAVGWAAAWTSEMAGRVTGRPVTLTRERLRQWTSPRWTISDARARREIGYESTVDLAAGMAETAAWYRKAGWI